MHWLKTTVAVGARVETPLTTPAALAKDCRLFGLSGRYELGTLNATIEYEICLTSNGCARLHDARAGSARKKTLA